MKREERAILNGLKKNVNEKTINVEIPVTYSNEFQEAAHKVLTIEKGFFASCIYWNDIAKAYAVHYIPAEGLEEYQEKRRAQESQTIETVKESLRVSDYTWTGRKKADLEKNQAEAEKEEGESMNTETKNTEAKKTGYNFEKYNSNVREFLLSKRMAFHAPRGNAKTGEIPAWNLLPGTSCPSWAKHHCFTEGCYALKNALRAGYTIENNSTFKAWAENTALAFYDLERLENELEKYFSSMAAPRFFRIHGSGEFFSEAYAAMWYRIAQRHPETRFLAFTKAWPIVRKVPFYTLENFELVLSGWTGIAIPEDLRAWYRCAWCMDGIETRIPADALECPGSCESCGMCWNLSRLGKDTYFHKH